VEVLKPVADFTDALAAEKWLLFEANDGKS